MAWTDPKTWTVGELVTAANMNTHLRDNLNALRTVIIRKPADETVNNSTTLQNDDHFLWSVGISEVWVWQLALRVESSSVADFKLAWTLPTSATGNMTVQGTEATISAVVWNAWASMTTAKAVSGQGINTPVWAWGELSGATASANAQLQWAQNSAEVSNTRVLTGSFLIAHRIS